MSLNFSKKQAKSAHRGSSLSVLVEGVEAVAVVEVESSEAGITAKAAAAVVVVAEVVAEAAGAEAVAAASLEAAAAAAEAVVEGAEIPGGDDLDMSFTWQDAF